MAEQIFTYLDPGEESALLATAPTKIYQRGETVLDQNVSERKLYVIASGSVRVERDNGGQWVQLAILSGGEYFGEMSFVDGAHTSARVVARELTQVQMIDAEAIERMDTTDQTFASRFYRSIAAILVGRLRQTSMDLYV